MKKTLIIKSLLAMLIVLSVGFSAVSCEIIDGLINGEGGSGNDIIDDGTDDENKDDEGKVDKSSLNAELALEVADQGDYTPDSYDAYRKLVMEAKEIADDESATQDTVDKITSDLTAARLALAVRDIEEVSGIDKFFRMISGDSKTFYISDYVNHNSLSNVSYQVKVNNAVLELSEITDGSFTAFAGEVNDATYVSNHMLLLT